MGNTKSQLLPGLLSPRLREEERSLLLQAQTEPKRHLKWAQIPPQPWTLGALHWGKKKGLR